jgi:RNA polymerase sigma-70 factor, ECF subfamily
VAANPETDECLLDRLRLGDEQAFVTLVQRYRPSMLRIASCYVPGRAIAEEVVQDTWLAALRGLSAFEGRSSVRTWLFRILVNRGRTTGAGERRSVPLGEDMAPAVDQSRFDVAGNWLVPPGALARSGR